MDQARLKIQEILQSHKILLQHTPISMNQQTLQDSASSSEKTPKYQRKKTFDILEGLIHELIADIKLTNLRERRRNEKAVEVSGSETDSPPKKLQEKLQGNL